MRTITFTSFLGAFFLLLPLLPNKEKARVNCVDDISFKGIAIAGDNAFTLPNGASYSGMGGLPSKLTFGKYEGLFQSVVTSQTQTPTGMEMELVHYFNDDKGNAFWTSDQATFTPLDTTLTRFQVYDVMTVVDGTGDFECASGQLINQGPVDFAIGQLEVNLTGKVCGGCD